MQLRSQRGRSADLRAPGFLLMFVELLFELLQPHSLPCFGTKVECLRQTYENIANFSVSADTGSANQQAPQI